MKHWTTEEIRAACDSIAGHPDTFKQQDMFKDLLEQRDVAVEMLRRLADKEEMDGAASRMSRAGSGDVRNYAAETLTKMGVK